MSPTPVGYVILTLIYEREGYKWVGTCEELGTSTYARTLKQCQRDLKDLVTEHLDLLEEEGERERFFEKWGIVIHQTKKAPQGFAVRLPGSLIDRLSQDPTAPSSPPFLRPSVFELPAPMPQREREPAGV